MSNVPVPPTFADPIVKDERTGHGYFNPIWIKWFLDFAQILQTLPNTTNHEGLSGLLGGAAGEHYHFTNAEHSTLAAIATGGTAGRLIGVQVFNATAVYTPTSGTSKVLVRVQAAGGAGGGVASTGAGQFAGGGGGGAGGYSESFITSAFSGLTMTIGAGGVPASGANGGNGANSSFGAVVVATGGQGRRSRWRRRGTVRCWCVGGNNVPGVGSGGTLINAAGAPGFLSLFITPTPISGRGGNSAFGGGAPEVTGSTAGIAAAAKGAGGSGASNLTSQSARSGGAGADGLGIIYEFA